MTVERRRVSMLLQNAELHVCIPIGLSERSKWSVSSLIRQARLTEEDLAVVDLRFRVIRRGGCLEVCYGPLHIFRDAETISIHNA